MADIIRFPGLDFTSATEQLVGVAGLETGVAHREEIVPKHKDVITPPHVRSTCLKYVKALGEKACVEWSVEYQWHYNTCYLEIMTANPEKVADEVKKATWKCLSEGAVLLAVSALITAATSGAATAVTEAVVVARFTECLERSLKDLRLLVSVLTVKEIGETGSKPGQKERPPNTPALQSAPTRIVDEQGE